MSPAELRTLATEILRIRRLLILSLLAQLKDDHALELVYLTAADRIQALWPIAIQRRVSMEKYALQPVQRKINREGILAQQEGNR